jgi:hypothetical protein
MTAACCAGFAVLASIATACSRSVTMPTPATNSSGPAVTPPRTFVVFGAVNEPGQGGVYGVRVLDAASTLSTQTGEGGRFNLAGLPTSQAHLRFEKDGYEPTELDAAPTAAANARVQQTIRLTAGETVMPHRLAPSDLTYVVGAGERCFSCRLVRIVVPARGTLHLRLTWTVECPVTLGLWVGGQHTVPLDARSTEVSATVNTGAGELIVYVDRASPSVTACHMPFVLATSLTE